LNKPLFFKYITPLTPVPTHMRPTGRFSGIIEGILFDIYGTLFISESGDISMAKKQMVKAARLEKLLIQYNIQKSPGRLVEEFIVAIETRHKELKKLGVDYPEVEQDRIWRDVLNISDQEKVRHFALEFELIVNPVYPMPNLKETLSALKKKGFLMGIISNAQFYTPYLFNWFLEKDIKQLGFNPDLVFLSYQFGYAKPSKVLFQLAVEKLNSLNIPVSNILYVGNDMLNDIYPATAAGFKTGLFAGDARSLRLRSDHPDCQNVVPDLVITDLLQLLDY